MKQVTQLEMDFLKKIKSFTETLFSSDEPMWAYLCQIEMDSKQVRALTTTLTKKGILKLTSLEKKNDSVQINQLYWQMIDNDIADFVNLEVE
jgi:hypothetical protein